MSFDHMNYGVARRDAIIDRIKALVAKGYTGLPVNNKWELQTNSDPDLRHLLRKGVLVRKRMGGGGRKRQTYLVLKP